MKLSLITATYNSSSTIADTLQSVASQSYGSIEHLIIDGLSKDHTLDIVQTFPHVSKVVSEKDKGIYDAMNKGIALASGEVIGILNSDDFYANEAVIEKVMKEFDDETVDLVYGDLQYVHPKEVRQVVRTWKAGRLGPKSFHYGWMPPHPTVFVRRRVYETYGNFNLHLKTAADYELMLRFLLKHQVKSAYVPEVLVKMRTGGASNATILSRIRANQQDKKAWSINGLKPNPLTLFFKPLRKINQFLIKQA
jgi:glycosyltransferase